MLDLSKWTKTCPEMRVFVRRELPHPGATLDAFEVRDGYADARSVARSRGWLDLAHAMTGCGP